MTHSATALQRTLAASNADISDATYEARQLRYAEDFGSQPVAVIREAFAEIDERIAISYLKRDQRAALVDRGDGRGLISDPATREPSP